MESIETLYKIGHGPSSSHTMGPEKACRDFLSRHQGESHRVILYGSLSDTGKGHLTDKIVQSFLPGCDVVFSDEKQEHPNTMDIIAFKNQGEVGRERYISIGGGSIRRIGDEPNKEDHVYPHQTFSEIVHFCKKENMALHDYVFHFEKDTLRHHLKTCWEVMKKAIDSGLNREGYLPGVLKVRRKAKAIYNNHDTHVDSQLRLISAYAYAVGEVNASGGKVVTAPTCGASGVLPAVLYYLHDQEKYHEDAIIDAMATAGIIGNVVRANGSISGAEAGCQAEIGTACSMAAAAYAGLKTNDVDIIDYAAEIALEHHLGLTCDPVEGYVQIPCIERNAVGAHRAINAGELAQFLPGTQMISFDTVVDAMLDTGRDLHDAYRETSGGGLAKKFRK